MVSHNAEEQSFNYDVSSDQSNLVGGQSTENSMGGLQGTPFAGLASEILSATNIMSGGLSNLTGMLGFGGSGNESQTSTQPQSNVVDNVLGLFNPMSQLASMLPNNQPNFDLLSSLDKQTEPSAARNIQTAAINSELSKNYSVSQNNTQTQASISNPAPIENADNKRSGVASASSYSSSPSWYLQLAGRISNDETMKFRGGVFA